MDKPYTYRAIVNKVVDGDTVDLDVDLGFGIWKSDRFRLYGPDPTSKDGMNAPEKNTPEGIAAASWLYHKIQGKEVYIETLKDRKEKYGRYLAVIWIEGEGNVNRMMLDAGHSHLKRYAHQEITCYGQGRETVHTDVPPIANSGYELRIADDVCDSEGEAGTPEDRKTGETNSGEEGRGREAGVYEGIRPRLPFPGESREPIDIPLPIVHRGGFEFDIRTIEDAKRIDLRGISPSTHAGHESPRGPHQSPGSGEGREGDSQSPGGTGEPGDTGDNPE